MFFEDYILFILAIELLGGITTSGVVPYPYIREMTMGCDFDPIWKLHSLSAALSLYSIFHGVAKYYVMHRVFRGGANNVGESFDLEVCRVVEGSCGLLAWFQTLQLLILDR